MKLSHYEMTEACAAADYAAAVELIRRNSTGEIVKHDVAAFPVFSFVITNSIALMPFEIQVWIGPRCWYWNDPQGYGEYDLSDYDFEPINPSERICIKKFIKE